MDNFKKKIAKVVEKIIGKKNIMDNQNLSEIGITSLNLLVLLSNIEEEFNIEIPEDEMNLDNFATIINIENLLKKLLIKKG
jgi:acyl carrier protein